MKKYARKKAFKKKGRRAYRKRRLGPSRMVSNTSPLPDRFFTKLTYSEAFAMTYTGSGAPFYHQFRINSIFDPNYSGTGHQPLGHDSFITLYNRYRVYGMKYKITFVNRETSYQVDIALQNRPNTTIHTNMDTIYESPYSQKVTLGIEGSGQAVRTLKGYASCAKILGISKTQLKTDDENSAIAGSNPTAQPMQTLYIFNQVSNQTAVISVRVEYVYFCEFYDRKLLTQS